MPAKSLSADHATSSKYRPDIDGLRAIAVVGVVVFHLEAFSFLPGGFLGVDIFLVISGYLITSVIQKSLDSGSFSLQNFYVRRAKRLLPAFFVVTSATIAASWIILGPAEMSSFSGSLISAILGVSNVYFMVQDSYWAGNASTLPLLHTWSLSVEEQFYLLFPAVLILSATYLSKTKRLFFFTLLAVASAALALWLSNENTTYAFYLLPTRAWELLVGVIIALLAREMNFHFSRFASGFMTLGGIGLVIFSYFYLGQFIFAPSVLTMVPVAGAALVIVGGMNENPVSKILSIRPVVGVGLISYSLYLWHYPILAMSELAIDTRVSVQLTAVLLAVSLSAATYRLIEVPFRQKKWRAPAKVFIGVATLFGVGFGLGGIATDGYQGNTPIPDTVRVASIVETRFLETVSSSQPTGTLMVFGDSHMQTLLPTLSDFANQSEMNFVDGTLDSCLFVLGLDLEDPTQSGNCDRHTQQDRLNIAQNYPESFVVIGGRYPLALEGERFNNGEGGQESGGNYHFWKPGTNDFSIKSQINQLTESTLSTAKSLSEQGHVLVLIYPIPEVGWNAPREVASRASGLPADAFRLDGAERIPWVQYSWPLPVPVTTSYQRYVERTESTFKIFDSIPGDKVIRIYPHEIFCDNLQPAGRCSTHSSTAIYYSDDDHLSLAGAQLLGREITRRISNWEPGS